MDPLRRKTLDLRRQFARDMKSLHNSNRTKKVASSLSVEYCEQPKLSLRLKDFERTTIFSLPTVKPTFENMPVLKAMMARKTVLLTDWLFEKFPDRFCLKNYGLASTTEQSTTLPKFSLASDANGRPMPINTTRVHAETKGLLDDEMEAIHTLIEKSYEYKIEHRDCLVAPVGNTIAGDGGQVFVWHAIYSLICIAIRDSDELLLSIVNDVLNALASFLERISLSGDLTELMTSSNMLKALHVVLLVYPSKALASLKTYRQAVNGEAGLSYDGRLQFIHFDAIDGISLHVSVMRNQQWIRKLEFIECMIGKRQLLFVGPAFAASIPDSDKGQHDWLVRRSDIIELMAKSAENFHSLIGESGMMYVSSTHRVNSAATLSSSLLIFFNKLNEPIRVYSRIADDIEWSEMPSSARMLQSLLAPDRACATISSCLHAGRGVPVGNEARVLLHIACTTNYLDFDMQGYDVDPLRYIDERAFKMILGACPELQQYYPSLSTTTTTATSRKRKSESNDDDNSNNA